MTGANLFERCDGYPGMYDEMHHVSVGYEDGHSFEEISKVKLEKQAEEENEDLAILESLAGQQQQ